MTADASESKLGQFHSPRQQQQLDYMTVQRVPGAIPKISTRDLLVALPGGQLATHARKPPAAEKKGYREAQTVARTCAALNAFPQLRLTARAPQVLTSKEAGTPTAARRQPTIHRG